MIQIQSILTIPGYKTAYWMKKDGKAKKISKSKWFQLYDLSKEEVKVLPPLTKTDIEYQKRMDKITKAIQNFA